MAKMIKINVEDHLLKDGNTECENVTQVTLPPLEFKTVSIEDVSGMAMDVDIPNLARFAATEYSINHNNGLNCNLLERPGVHSHEFRAVRMVYDKNGNALKHELVKYRLGGMFKGVDGGTLKTGDPWGSTVKYSTTRYEEIVGGVQTKYIDATSNKIVINGVDYSSDISTMLQ